jgi:hypothetical protein
MTVGQTDTLGTNGVGGEGGGTEQSPKNSSVRPIEPKGLFPTLRIGKLNLTIASPFTPRGPIPAQTRQFPAGKRIYLRYTEGKLVLEKRTVDSQKIEGETMTIEDGCDWALVRNDGMLVLEARLSAKSEDDASHISMAFSGLANIGELYGLSAGNADTYERWIADKPPKQTTMGVALTIRFDVSMAPEANAALRYVKVSQNYRQFIDLGQRVCVGRGTITVGTDVQKVDREVGYLKSLDCDLHQLVTGT